MPFLRFDLLAEWTDDEVGALLDAAHGVVLEAFGVPERDRYQVVHQHPTSHVRMEDTGLGFDRTRKQIFLQVTSRPRSVDQKRTFYRLMAERLEAACGVPSEDLVMHIVENSDADWSFGRGEAQFLTGRLG